MSFIILYCVILSCYKLGKNEEEFQFSKILTPIFFAQREVELVPSELMQHFRPHSEDKYVFELLKQLMGFALVM